MCPCDLDLWPISPKKGHVTTRSWWMHAPILKFIDVLVFEILILNCRFSVCCKETDVAMATIFCSTRWMVFLRLASKYELDTTTQYWVITVFIWIRYVTLWPWPLTYWPWSHVTLCHLGESVYQVRTWYDLPLGRLQFSIDRQLKVPICKFFGNKWGQISNLIFLTPKRHFLVGNDA